MTRKALCVGINYVGTSAELRGCVRDALDWQHVLEDRDYLVARALDAEATKEQILAGLADLVRDARWGDRLVFTYSGHGTNLRDLDGDEADGRDEALVSVDMNTIRDDEIHAVIGRLPYGVRLTVISDSCFSGSVTRLVGIQMGRLGEKVRYLPPHGLGVDGSPRLRSVRPGAAAMLLSGCRDDQVSYDALIGGVYRGAMTAAAIATLPVSSTMREWHARTLGAITHPQDPVLTATAYQRRLKPLA